MKRLASVVRDLLLTLAILLALGLVVVRLDGGQGETMAGRPHVVDGDTLVLDGKRIRLAGIDAPELRQVCHRDDGGWPCGAWAREHLALLTGNAKTTCEAGGSDRYGRLLAVCSSGGVDLNAAMVGSGYAIAFGDYEAQEQAAKEEGLGLWSGTFDPPQTWRRTHGGMDEEPHIGDGWPGAALREIGGELRKRLSGIWSVLRFGLSGIWNER